jgi:hypothetical protein
VSAELVVQRGSNLPGGVWRQSRAVVFYLNERNRNAFTEDQTKREILDRKRMRDDLLTGKRQGAG